MYLSVTVALDKKQHRDRGLKGLLRAIRQMSDDVEFEIPHFDKKGRWSYTFNIEVEKISTLRKILREHGRYKLIKVVDINHNETLLPKRNKELVSKSCFTRLFSLPASLRQTL